MPYVGLQFSHYLQSAYQESGASLVRHNVSQYSSNYLASEAGLEFRSKIHAGMAGAKLGWKHIYTGCDPETSFSFAMNPATSYSVSSALDKNLLVAGLYANTSLGGRWTLTGDLQLEKGIHTQNVMARINFRYSF